jgi:hypothetical protein
MSSTLDGNDYGSVPSSSDGLDCITAYDIVEEEPLQTCDRSSGWPNNSGCGPSVSVDRATIPTRTNKKPIHFAETHFQIVTVHEIAADPVFLFPIHCFYTVHEHIRERAPPRLT